MNGPIDEDAAPGNGSADRAADLDDEARVRKREQKREQNRRYRARHPEEHAAGRRQWIEANRDRVRETNRRWRAEHLDRALELNRDSMRRSTARKRRDAELRARGRERAKRWREAHPERVREYQKGWVQENREKVREYYNRYYATHRDEVNARAAARRDADPERTKQAHKEWAQRNKDRRAELQRERRSDPEVYRAELDANAAARRLKRRLEHAGLPPKRLHPITAAERRAHEREAAAYFGEPDLSEHVRQFSVFAATLTEQMLERGERMREFAEAYVAMRERMGLPAVNVEQIMYARAVEIVTDRVRRIDLLTSRDVAAAVRSTDAVVRQEERSHQYEQLVKALVALVESHAERLSEEAALENRVRHIRGRPVGSLESLVLLLATNEVVQEVPTSHLSVQDAQRAAREAKLRILIAHEPSTFSSSDSAYHRPLT
ncbi:hypothetical protein [Agromyces albus]|uniref:Uncharacterized protein n=1 Tax=Agromyces albus TaxID=205332 RepID=A0A4Q2KXB3_9MICO|nr:hypothetical protein [Agromyces albus]RXZ70278.1 hypothetical protein ESP51_10325 [Agromyces albus]